ncbi:SLBB domain-containing protein [candidate division KSB1 bacterium]|nr:SLBB domain-containing protein [candidate division KSB1 bacterium]
MRTAFAIAAFFLLGSMTAAQNLPLANPLTPSEPAPVGDPVPAAAAELQPFGYHLFSRQSPLDQTPESGVLPKGYRLGPGDVIGIFLGGTNIENFQVTVTVDGKIFVPTVGVLSVQGLEFDRLYQVLDQALHRYYSDYRLELMLIQPKRIRVAVLGQVSAPGYVTLGGFGSVVDALMLAQGATPHGSLRNIRIFRADSLAAEVDLYTLLLDPAQSETVLLQNGDRIFVPDVQKRVTLQGEVKRPAIYELCEGRSESVADLIAWAGGPTDLAYLEKIELSRLNPNGTRSIHFFAYPGPAATDMPLKNLDRLTLYSSPAQLPPQEVTLHGEVKKPGVYSLESNMRVSDLILQAGNLLRSAYLLQAEVAKIEPLQSPRIVKIDLAGVMSGAKPEEDLLLEPDDHVFVRRIPQWQIAPLVEVSGEVIFPGTYPITRDSTTLSEIIEKAGGFAPEALIDDAKLIRIHAPMVEDKEFERLKEMSRDQMSDAEYEYFVMKQNVAEVKEIVVDWQSLIHLGQKNQDVVLQDGDRVFIPKKPTMIMVSGRVARAGGVLYQPGASYKYYIEKAGGFAWDASPRHAKVIKASGEILNDEDVETFAPGDRIWVPRKKDKSAWQTMMEALTAIYQMATVYLVIRAATE